MGLTYHYKLRAPAGASPQALEAFLKHVEKQAQKLGFKPTFVFHAPFDTPERREFARRLAISVGVEDSRLAGVSLPLPEMVWDHNPLRGTCRITPQEGVILVVTDERGCETCFGFMRYPEKVLDLNGKVLAETRIGPDWCFEDFIKTPDPRYRQLVALFRERNFVAAEQDDYAPR